jgi:hypothetical protein
MIRSVSRNGYGGEAGLVIDENSGALDRPFRASTTSAKRWRLRRGKSSCTPTGTEWSTSVGVFPRPKLHFGCIFMIDPC